ncbi:MAG: 4Fe-4S dicluster-binding protein, partial [Flavobacteriales bacterium]
HKVVARIDENECIGCQLCYIACEDGAHQAIALPENGSRVPEIIDENCVGCNLCSLVCPVEDCITMEKVDDGTEQLTWQERTDKGNIPTSFDDDKAGGKGHYVPKPEEALKNKK